MRIVRIRAVQRLTGLSKATIRRLEQLGEFPPRRRLLAGAVGWLEGEVETWLGDREVVAASENRDTKEG